MRIEIVQPNVPVTTQTAHHFFDDSLEMRPGGCTAALGALAAKTLAQRYGGTAKFEATPPGGNTLRLVPIRRS